MRKFARGEGRCLPAGVVLILYYIRGEGVSRGILPKIRPRDTQHGVRGGFGRPTRRGVEIAPYEGLPPGTRRDEDKSALRVF